MGIVELFRWLWEQFESYIFPFVIIHVYERGAILTNGKNPRLLNPGFHLKIPFIQIVFTATITPDTLCAKAIHATTKDGKTITVEPTIEYTIEDPLKWIIWTNDAKGNLHDILRGRVSDYISGLTWDEVVNRTTTELKKKLNKRLEEIGVTISEVMLTDMCLSRVIITQI
jgi:regulator of protease activity HflC (stomatin/prohibitin superfamily)